MNGFSGIGKLDRTKLTLLLRSTKHTISIAEATKVLNIKKRYASQLLARWARKGWLSRIKRGIYISVPFEAKTSNIQLEDPWVIAEKLYAPCYIGGWSAAEHWGLTEQIFTTILICTTKKSRSHIQTIKGTKFLLRKIPETTLFGLRKIWRSQIKVLVSDPTRTLLDFLIDPKLGGGINTVSEMLVSYLKSEYKDLSLLIDYAKKLGNGSVFKRLGFLLEIYAPAEVSIIEQCIAELTTGNNKLDSELNADHLITRWRLWVPKSWKKTNDH
jgi:predicted transcriptional regulator of viral defense system